MYRDEFNDLQKQTWWSMPRVFLLLAVAIVAISALGFIATGGNFLTYKFWAPKQENVRRQVFENTQSYVQGKIASLSQERLAYQMATPGSTQQTALRTMIITEASTVDSGVLPADLNAFVNSLKGAY